ncbi:MAG: DUF460 domain-containing protein [Candidatus Micrarchaeota archaeon]
MHLIIGIDPGINVGYAALNLDGKLITCGCVRDANEEDIVKLISRFGIPSITGSDVTPPPNFVSKIAARFNVKVIFPKESMQTDQKKKIAKNISDPHTRDAYSAAVKAYRFYANRLRQIDKLETNLDKDKLKHAIIQGIPIGQIIKTGNYKIEKERNRT